jgi:hypothetical protein
MLGCKSILDAQHTVVAALRNSSTRLIVRLKSAFHEPTAVHVDEERECGCIFAAIDPDGMLVLDVDLEDVENRIRLDRKTFSRHAIDAGIRWKVVREL